MGGGGTTLKPPVRVALAPPGFVTVTSRGPGAAPEAMPRLAVIWVDDVTVTP